MTLYRTLSIALVALVFGWAGNAHAGTTQGTMSVTATVLNSCLVAATPMAFGNYDPNAASPTNATSLITVTCTTGASFVVGLNAGTAAGATVGARQMSNSAQRLNYALFSDSARSTNWGNTSGVDTPAAITATVLPSVLTVYGQIAAGQNVPAGAYADTVTVTVTY